MGVSPVQGSKVVRKRDERVSLSRSPECWRQTGKDRGRTGSLKCQVGKKKNSSGLPSQAITFVTRRECTSRYIQDIFWINLWNTVWKHCGDRWCFSMVACWGILFSFYPVSFLEFYCKTRDHRQVDLNQYLVIFHNKTNAAKKGSLVTPSMVAAGWGGGMVVQSIRDISQD